MKLYAIEEYYSGAWQPVASADTERGVIENLIDLHNDPETISEGAYRLVKYETRPDNHNYHDRTILHGFDPEKEATA